MKKFLLTASVISTLVLISISSAKSNACWDSFKDNGDSDGDTCQNQECVFERNKDFSGATLSNCGGSTGGGKRGGGTHQ